MPAKAAPKKPAAPKPLDAHDIFAAAEAGREAEDVVKGVLEVLVERGGAVIHRHFMEQLAKEVTAGQAVENAIKACQLQLLPHDYICESGVFIENSDEDEDDFEAEEEEPVARPSRMPTMSISIMNETDISTLIVAPEPEPEPETPMQELQAEQQWHIGTEPPCCDVDRMGRGMVQIKRKPMSVAENHFPDQPLSARSTTASFPYATVGGKQKKKDKEKDKAPAPVPLEVKVSSEVKEIEKMRDQELKRMTRKKRQQEKLEKQREKAAGDEAKQRAVEESMKGKNFIYDDAGNAVLIQTLNPDKMPKIQQEPKVSVTGGVRDDDDEGGGKGGKKKKGKGAPSGPKAAGPGRRRSSMATRKAGEVAAPHFVEAVKTGSKMLQQIKMVPGVALKTATMTRAEPVERDSSDVKKMTRAEYVAMLDSQQPGRVQQQTVLVSEQSAQASGSDLGGGAPAAVAPSAGAAASVERAMASAESARGMATQASVEDLPPPPRVSVGRLRTEDVENNFGRAMGGGGGARAQLNPVGTPTPIRKSALDDFDQTNQNDPGWGSNHQTIDAVRKARLIGHTVQLQPDEREKMRQKTVGNRSKLPKQRPHMEKNSGPSKHLPKPVYPAVSGHGFMTGYLKHNALDETTTSLPAIASGTQDLSRSQLTSPVSSNRASEWFKGTGKNNKTFGTVQTTEKTALYFQS